MTRSNKRHEEPAKPVRRRRDSDPRTRIKEDIWSPGRKPDAENELEDLDILDDIDDFEDEVEDFEDEYDDLDDDLEEEEMY